VFGGCLIPQGPTVCQTNHHPPPTPRSTPTNKSWTGSTKAQARTVPAFIDDSTSEHHQCHPDRCRACGVCAP